MNQPDVPFLVSFASAWNRHDIDALMQFMTDDCVFESSFGIEPCGTLYQGSAAVRDGFSRAWLDYPDAQWLNAHHFVRVVGVSLNGFSPGRALLMVEPLPRMAAIFLPFAMGKFR